MSQTTATSTTASAHAAYSTPLPELEPGKVYHHFKLERTEEIPEISGCAYIFSHTPSNARALWLSCADNNKSFSIAFKTPPVDSTGVFHILEHSVLCGSKRYPVKEPFVHLLKTSMQTFLNAMTFPDKTVYPVSSTNEQDLINLSDIYLDAVLHPNIYTNPLIFEQEGWHYELASANDPLSYNGVVLNEMRGALSNPDTVMYNALNEALFPDSCYKYVSGGTITDIPTLTREAFLKAHHDHYTLKNSYTILYGNLNILRMLEHIDRHFAGAESERENAIPHALTYQKPVCPGLVRVPMKTAQENKSIGLGYVIGDYRMRKEAIALSILCDVLCATNESPLKKAVLEAGLGKDMNASLIDACLQPQLMFQLKGAKEGVSKRFRELVENSCREYAEKGIDKKRLEAALSQTEFSLREGDWGGSSDGVCLSIQALNGWLYDDSYAVDYLHFQDALTQLRATLDDGYFEQLLYKVVCESTHTAQVELICQDSATKDEETTLEHIKSKMTPAEREKIIAHTEALKQSQAAPDTPEALATLPQLHISDIGEVPASPKVEQGTLDTSEAGADIPFLYHPLPTHQIGYLYAYFDLRVLSFEDLPYVGILQELLGKLDTRAHSASDLDILVEDQLGGFSSFTSIYHKVENPHEVYPYFVIHASALSEKLAQIPRLIQEIATSTKLDTLDKIKPLLIQRKIGLEQAFINSAHACCMDRLAMYRSQGAALADEIEGVNHYFFLKDLLNAWDSKKSALATRLSRIANTLFTDSNATISFTGSAADFKHFSHIVRDEGFLARAAARNVDALVLPTLTPLHEAFIIPSHVNFVGAGTAAAHFDTKILGPWNIAARALSLEYLWNELRVLGGAYGAGFTHTASGYASFWSYRDPALDESLERYRRASAWLKSWTPTASELEGYIVSCTAALDAPVKPYVQARREDSDILSKKPANWHEMIRAQQLACTPAQLKTLWEEIHYQAEDELVCVFGSKEAIEEAHTHFDCVRTLLDEGESA